MDLSKAKRILIKLGTQVVIDENGKFSDLRVKRILTDLHEFYPEKEFLVVTSGAVGLGRNIVQLSANSDVSEKQACAAIGQVLLMNSYNKIW